MSPKTNELIKIMKFNTAFEVMKSIETLTSFKDFVSKKNATLSDSVFF
jgi:hypothetical protein